MPMQNAPKVLFLGIDAGDRVLIRRWCDEGALPNLRALLARGLVGETKSVEGFYEGSTWPSFYTGVHPAHHGFHRLVQLEPGTYEFHRCDPGEFIQREPFWNRLSAAGKRVAILDIPLAGRSTRLNGIQMVEWGSHDAAYGFQTWPPGLKREVLQRFGAHPASASCDAFRRSPQQFCRFRDRLLEGVKRKADLTLHYLKEGNWDFLAQVFTEGHCAGHQCWHLHDPAHPDYDPQIASLTGDPIREVYRAIDSAIGRILAQVDARTIVFILATHRMAHNIGAAFLLEEVLEKLNYLRRVAPGAGAQWRRILGRMAAFAKARWKDLPASVQTVTEPALFPAYKLLRSCVCGSELAPIASRLDLEQSRCFPQENGNLISGIRINVLGREPCGTVKAGAELEELCRRITRDLLEIVEKDSGIRMVNRVLRTSGFFQGEYLDYLPDLLVEWSEDQRVGSAALGDGRSSRLRLTSDRIGTIEGRYTYCRTGDHRPEGLCIVCGPGINPGVIQGTISIMDFAPTFLHLFHIQDTGLDGKPIRAVFAGQGR